MNPRRIATLFAMVILVQTGCVMVETPDVRVGVVGSPPARSGSSAEPTAPYTHALDRVIDQQENVAEELRKRDFDELSDEAQDWLGYVRELAGYADTSHDPATFRRCCDDLVRETKRLRDAARRRDAAACRSALQACDPVLDTLSRTCPRSGTAGAGARSGDEASASKAGERADTAVDQHEAARVRVP